VERSSTPSFKHAFECCNHLAIESLRPAILHPGDLNARSDGAEGSHDAGRRSPEAARNATSVADDHNLGEVVDDSTQT